MDSLDSCCKTHDLCYESCEKGPPSLHKTCIKKCDAGLVGCLKDLSDDCRKWPKPPRKGTEDDSNSYRNHAISLFK